LEVGRVQLKERSFELVCCQKFGRVLEMVVQGDREETAKKKLGGEKKN
jgi:hypothetical protein